MVDKFTKPPYGEKLVEKINEIIDNLGGGGSAPEWGNISGTLSNQTDLQSALDAKQNVIDISQLSYYGTCSTAAATQAKVVVCPEFTELKAGVSIRVKFTNAQSYNGQATLNVNSTGAKGIVLNGTTKSVRYCWNAGEVVSFTYDGTNWVMEDAGIASTSYYGYTKLYTGATSTNAVLALSPASLNSLVQNMIEPYPVYSATATYEVGDRVRYSYNAWECNTAIETAEAWTAAHWTMLDPIQTQIDDISSNQVTSVNNVEPVNGNVTLSIPSVGNGTITFTQGGVTKGTITTNQSGDSTIALDAGGESVDAYTKAETDAKLAKKQDVLTPNAPLTISSYIKSNMHGFSYATPTSIYSTSGNSSEYYSPRYSWQPSQGGRVMLYAPTSAWVNDTWSTSEDSFKAYIDIPIRPGQVVVIPSSFIGYLGTFNDNGAFFPKNGIGCGTGGMDRYWTDDINTYTSYGTVYLFNNSSNTMGTSVSVSSMSALTDYIVFQMLEDDTTTTIISKMPGSSYPEGYEFDKSNAPFDNINTLRVVRQDSTSGYDSNTAIDISKLGLYDYDGNIADFSDEGRENLFDISGEQAYNYLDLHIGTGLAVQDGNLVNTNPNAPDMSDYYTKNETSALLSTKQDLLHEQAPLEISVNTIDNVTTSSNMTYDATTGAMSASFTTAGEEGWIKFLIPSNVNIDALNDYWRIGSAITTPTIICTDFPGNPQFNFEVLRVSSESGDISRVWRGSSAYRKGNTTSTGSYRVSNDTFMVHNAGETVTHCYDNSSDDWSAGYTITSSRLKEFVLYYYKSNSYPIATGIATSQYYTNFTLPEIRLFTSPEDTEGITLAGTTTTKYLKLNIGTGLSVVDGALTASAAPDTDNVTISTNSDDELQAIGVIDNNSGNALKYWTGTRTQYDAIATKDSTTLYFLSDVGKIYFGDTLISNVSSNTLFDFKWTDHQLNDIRFLRADTFSWQDGGVYSTAYNHLVQDIQGITAETETIGSYTVTFYRATDGHKICLADQEQTVLNIYNTYGIAWYYILDTTNTQFKLPRTKYGFEGLRTNVGDKIDESLPNITGRAQTAPGRGGFIADGALQYFETQNASNVYSSGTPYTGTQYGIRFNASYSSPIYKDNAHVQERATQMYLYFYVGDYSQSAIEQTAGLNSELFNGKADVDGSNMDASVKNFDGVWKFSYTEMINSSTTLNAGTTYRYSLASYLPNDGYIYEVMFSCDGQTGTTSGNVAEIAVGSDIITYESYRVTSTITRTNAMAQWAGSGTMIIGTNRQIYIRQVNKSSACNCFHFRCYAYRRIGTNQ